MVKLSMFILPEVSIQLSTNCNALLIGGVFYSFLARNKNKYKKCCVIKINVLDLLQIKTNTMNHKTKRKLVIVLDVALWIALLFFGYKYFTGC